MICLQETEACYNRISEIEEEFAEGCVAFSVLSSDSDPYTDGQMRISLTTNYNRLVEEGKRLYDDCYETWKTNGFDKEAREISVKRMSL